MADIDASNPSDNAIVSTFPSNERDSRAAVVAVIGEEHSATTGRHKIPRGTTVVRDAVTDWEQGSLYVNTTTGSIQHQEASSSPFDWKDVSFPAGTKMVFYQASAPTGWTQDVAVNDQMLRVVSGSGGGTGGSWTISGATVDGTAITTAQLPVVTGSMEGVQFNSSGNSASGVFSLTDQGDRANGGGNLEQKRVDFNLGGGETHTHGLTSDGTWRPAYINIIVATKDAL